MVDPKAQRYYLKINMKRKLGKVKTKSLFYMKREENPMVVSLDAGEYKDIHKFVVAKLGIVGDFNAPINSIRNRAHRKSLTVHGSQNQHSPVAAIEPIILRIVVWKQEAGQPITPTEGLQLANSLIQKKHCEKT